MLRRALYSLLILAGLVIAAAGWFSFAWTLEGTAVDAETGRPLQGVVVSGAGWDTLSDAGGRFSLRGLRGPLMVRAGLPGYRSLSRLLSVADLFGLRGPVTLRLEPVELCGTVVDASTRAPIAGAIVAVGESQVRTDEQGRYTARRLLPGTELRARATYYRESEPARYHGQEAQHFALQLLPATVTVRDLCSREPLPGVDVTAGEVTLQSDAQGALSFPRLAPRTEVRATHPGYQEARAQASPGEHLVLDLRPSPLRGTVRSHDGRPLPGALVLARIPGQAPQLTYTNAAGEYVLENAPAGATLIVRQAGYRRLERLLDHERCHDVQLEPHVVKGIYLAFHLLRPANQATIQANLELVDRSELNAIVIEIKTETGYLGFQPRLAVAREIGAGFDDVIDVRALLADCKRRGVYTIARIPIFEDDLLATKKPEWAIHRSNGAVWRAAGGRAWTDPFRREVWDYNVGIASEAVELGFDEVQFDYVRFPSDGSIRDCRYARESTAESRVEAISEFVAYARQEIDKTGAFFSIDLFGLTTFDTSEQGIGQLLEKVAPHVDYLSPMVYPSTYLPGMLDLRDPWRSPYEVVKLSMIEARKRTSTLIRPWLQHYDDYHGVGITYGLREYGLQKQAAAEGGAHGWLFWNILGEYDPAAFEAG